MSKEVYNPEFLLPTVKHRSGSVVIWAAIMITYVLFCMFCSYRANWHSPATLTEGVFFSCFFLSCKANANQGKLRKDGALSALLLVVNCFVLGVVSVDCVVLCVVCL